MSTWTTLPLGQRSVNLDRRRIPVKESERRPGRFPYYGASGVVDHVDEYLFEGLHLLVAEDGENLRSRKLPVAFLADGQFWVNNHAHVLQANDENDLRFLAYALENTDISGYITGSAQPKLTQVALASIPIAAPCLRGQREIASILSALDDKIASNRRAQALTEELVSSYFERWFPVDLNPDGVPVCDLVNINPRRALSRDNKATYVGMSSLPEHSAEVDNWQVKEFGTGQKFVNGDVLMARITPCLENGKTAIVDMLKEGEVGWGSTEYVVLSPKGDVTTPWIYCLVRSDQVRSFAIRSMTGTSGRQRFQADGFEKYRITAPDPELLKQFNFLAVPLFDKMTQLRDENRSLRVLRDVLMAELLTPRLRAEKAEESQQ